MSFKLIVVLLLIGIVHPSDLSYYELLGITKSATQQEIRQAYKRLAIKLHPDKNPNASEQQKFIKISEAYETLKDPEKRRKYDLYGSYPSYTRQYDSTSQAEYNNLYYNGLYANDLYVHTISGNTFYSFLSEGFHFINFYSPFCPPCQNLAEHWKKLAEKYKEIIKIGAVNCKYHNSFCYNSMRITSYPTLLFYPNGKHGNYVYYRNEQNIEALESFIMSYIKTQVQVPVVTQIRSTSDRPIAYIMGTSWLDTDAITRIAYRLKGLTLLVIVKDEDLKKKLTKDDYTTVVLKYDGNTKEIKSTVEDEILSEIVENLPKSESIDSEKLKEIRFKLRNNQIEPWVLHFTSGSSEKLLTHKLKNKFKDINFGEIDCSRWSQLCLSLQVESPPAWALIKRGGAYQRLTATSYQELATQLPQALKAHNLQTLSTSEFLRILDGDVNTWTIAVIPQHSSWNQVAEAFTEISLHYQHLNIQFGVMLCTSDSEVYCHRVANHRPVVIVQNGTRLYTHADHLDQASIIEFIDTLRDTADIDISETEVLEISSTKRKYFWLVGFLPPWCGHSCDFLEHEWRIVAKKLRILPLIRVGLLRCASRSGICNNVQSAVIRLYPIASGHSYTVSMEHLSRAPYMWEWALTYIDDSVQQLQSKTFSQIRKELGPHHQRRGSKPWLVYFHSPRCYRCYEMYADYVIAGILLKNAVNLGKVNCISERAICQEEQIVSYPSLKLYLGSTEDRPFTTVQPIALRDYKTIIEMVKPHLHKDENIKLGLPDIKFDLKHDEF